MSNIAQIPDGQKRQVEIIDTPSQSVRSSIQSVKHRAESFTDGREPGRPALNSFYGKLDDEQKAQFETLGLQQVSQAD